MTEAEAELIHGGGIEGGGGRLNTVGMPFCCSLPDWGAAPRTLWAEAVLSLWITWTCCCALFRVVPTCCLFPLDVFVVKLVC